jgi:ATP-dependent DNA helicase RecG
MNFEELQHLTSQGEGEDLEFKASTSQIDAGNKSLCGFLNTGGGRVLFGVRNDGRVEGQEVSDGTQQTIAQKLGKLEPTSSHETEFVPVPETDLLVIVLTARPSPELVPYIYDGRAYERVGTTTQLMSQQRYQELLIARTQSITRWETGVAQGLNVGQLDEEEILRTARRGIDAGRLPETTEMNSMDVLSRLSLLTSGVVSNAAAVLFGKDLVAHYPQCILRAARFRGLNRAYSKTLIH